MRWLPSRHTLPWWLLLVSLAFNLGFGATYGAKTYGPTYGWPPGPPEPGPMAPIRNELQLTDEQQAVFRELESGLRQEIDARRRRMHEARLELAELLLAAETDGETIAAKLNEISEIQREVQAIVVARLMEQKQLLRPDQLEAFNRVVRHSIFSGGRIGGRGAGRGDRWSPQRSRRPGGWGGRAGERRGNRENRGSPDDPDSADPHGEIGDPPPRPGNGDW